MADEDEHTLDFDELSTDEEGGPVIELGDETFRLPHHDLIEQNVSVDSLIDSIDADGIEYPIVVEKQSGDVIPVFISPPRSLNFPTTKSRLNTRRSKMKTTSYGRLSL